MSELDEHLTQVYRRDVMGESVKVEMPAASPGVIKEIEDTIARIDALRLGPSLASRDFVSYQHRRALMRLLLQLRTEQARRRALNAAD